MRATCRQWVGGRSYGNEFHTACLDPLDTRNNCFLSADADISNAGMNELSHGTQRLDKQAQSDRRERRLECPHGINQSGRRQHHIDGESYLRFQAIT
jgi:hypothetical protein